MHSGLQSGNFRRRFPHQRNWTNPAGALTKLKVDDRGNGVRIPVGKVFSARPALESHIYMTDTGAFSLQTEHPESWSDHSPLSSAQNKKVWELYTRSPVCIYTVTLNYSQGHFICSFLYENTVFRVITHRLHGCDNTSHLGSLTFYVAEKTWPWLQAKPH
jgi:hypothetical protein